MVTGESRFPFFGGNTFMLMPSESRRDGFANPVKTNP
jgi:hypothetical protein